MTLYQYTVTNLKNTYNFEFLELLPPLIEISDKKDDFKKDF